MEQAFFDVAATTTRELQRYAGQIAPAQRVQRRWVNTFDLRISQELPGFMEGPQGRDLARHP